MTSPPPALEDERPARPTVAEVRAVGQPPGLLDRDVEQWGGRLYMRKLSPHVSRALLRTPVTPNGVTWSMNVTGLLAAAVLTLPGVLAAVAGVLLIQIQLLFDCVDGEMARWRRTYSAVGPYLDKLAHYVTEAALPIAIGIRADGGWDRIGGWTTLGLLVAVLWLLVKAESALVTVARAEAGRPPATDAPEVRRPRQSVLRRLRAAIDLLPFYRAFQPVELTLLVLAASAADVLAGDLAGTRWLLTGLLAAAAVTVTGHLAAILASNRLR